jgi:hypothetical protein
MSDRSLHEAYAAGEPAWPVVHSWIQSAKNRVEILAPLESQRDQVLRETQVTLGSPMGAIVHNTGGLLVDRGWLRFLGSGSPSFSRSLPSWNRGRSSDESGNPRGFWLVADDVIGGFFALNGGAFQGPKAGVFYFAPDSLCWEPLTSMSYTEFLCWSFNSNLDEFYASFRWPGWEAEISSLTGDEALSIYPSLFTREGKDITKSARRRCPVSEIYDLNVIEFPKQLNG